MKEKKKILSAMAKFGDTQGELAKALGVSGSWLSKKINEKEGALFTQKEITFIKNRYQLHAEEICEIFLHANEVGNDIQGDIQVIGEICKPLVEFLMQRHPYCYIVVSQKEIKLLETTIGVPTENNLS